MSQTTYSEIIQEIPIKLEAFGSEGILKVLRAVYIHGSLNITLLAKKVQMTHTAVDANVNKLKNMGLVIENRYGKIRMIKPAFDTFSIRFKRGIRYQIKAQNLK